MSSGGGGVLQRCVCCDNIGYTSVASLSECSDQAQWCSTEERRQLQTHEYECAFTPHWHFLSGLCIPGE